MLGRWRLFVHVYLKIYSSTNLSELNEHCIKVSVLQTLMEQAPQVRHGSVIINANRDAQRHWKAARSGNAQKGRYETRWIVTDEGLLKIYRFQGKLPTYLHVGMYPLKLLPNMLTLISLLSNFAQRPHLKETSNWEKRISPGLRADVRVRKSLHLVTSWKEKKQKKVRVSSTFPYVSRLIRSLQISYLVVSFKAEYACLIRRWH